MLTFDEWLTFSVWEEQPVYNHKYARCAWEYSAEQSTTKARKRCVERCEILMRKFRSKERRYIVQRCIDYIMADDNE